MFFLDPRLFLNEEGHELAEEFAHGVHTLLAGGHVIEGMAHRQEDGLHPSGVMGEVLFGAAYNQIRFIFTLLNVHKSFE
jgi:hypothetical protein